MKSKKNSNSVGKAQSQTEKAARPSKMKVQEIARSKDLSELGSNYARMLADTKNNAQVACIAPTLDMAQQVKFIPCTASFQMSVGLFGYGFAVINPTTGGPTGNTQGWYTTPAWGGAGSNSLIENAACTTFTYTESSFVGSPTKFSTKLFRTVACCAYVTPVGSALQQNGRLFLHEAAGHTVVATQVVLDKLKSSARTRSIRGVQMGDPAVLNVLNWHPKAGAAFTSLQAGGINEQGNVLSNIVNDLTFRSLPQPTDPGVVDIRRNCELIIIVTGEPGALYDVDVVTYYEMIGPDVDVNIPMIVSSEQFDLVRNALGFKKVSGSIGKPAEIAKSYSAFIEHTSRVAHGRSVPDQPWYRSMLEQAKDVGGFALAASKAVGSFL